MIATIVEIIRVYGKSDRRHETITPFLTVRMRTAPKSWTSSLSASSLLFLEFWRDRGSQGPSRTFHDLNRPNLRGVINRDFKVRLKSVSS
jgi:hypothetical protein